MMIGVYDAGHGGSDSGATSKDGKRLEKDWTLKFAKKAKADMEKRYNVKILMTRTNDTYKSLTYRKNFANKNKADFFVSFHFNAPSTAHGFELFTTMKSAKGTKLARNILSELNKENKKEKLMTANRGLKHKMFTVITCDAPSTLLELCFIGNNKDFNLFKKNEDRYVKAINDAIAKTYNIKKKKAETKPVKPIKPVEPKEDEIYRVKKGGWKGKQNGAYKNLLNAIKQVDKLGKKEWAVYDSRGVEVYPKMYNDIKGHWAEEAIKYVIDKGIMVGNEKLEFEPNRAISRAEVAVIIHRLMKEGK